MIKHHPIPISQDNAGAKNPGMNIVLLLRRSVSLWWFIAPHVKMEVIIAYPHFREKQQADVEELLDDLTFA